MRNRFFLLALLVIILLMQAVLRAAAQATPFSGGSTWGNFSFWELRGALPLGVFAIGTLFICTAAIARLFQASVQLTNSKHPLIRKSSSIATACLWCGVPCMASTLNALPYIFPWMNAHDPGGWQTTDNLHLVLSGCIILLIICHFLQHIQKLILACFIIPASLLCLLSFGKMGFNLPFILIPSAAVAFAGITLAMNRRRAWGCILILTAALLNALLFQLTAPALSTTPASWVMQGALLLVLALPFYLKSAPASR